MLLHKQKDTAKTIQSYSKALTATGTSRDQDMPDAAAGKDVDMEIDAGGMPVVTLYRERWN
jgi:hypothetical protein